MFEWRFCMASAIGAFSVQVFTAHALGGACIMGAFVMLPRSDDVVSLW
jgi:hypothetical protein